MIPESKQAAVARALRTALGANSADTISLMTGGLSSALVYRIGVGGMDYLLRVIMRADAFNDPPRQYLCMRKAAEAGIAPRVWYASDEDAVSITDFVVQRPRQADTIVRDLAVMTGRIHGLKGFPGLVDYLDGVDGFIGRFQASGLLPAVATEEHFRFYAEIQRCYPRYETDLVASHNDLNPNNILFDGARLWIVDWEAAFANDRYVDLAAVGNTFARTPEQEDELLGTYFGAGLNEYRRARWFLMRQVCHMFYAMCFFAMASASKPEGVVMKAGMEAPDLREFYLAFLGGAVRLDGFEGQLLYGKVLMRESLRMMKLARYEESLRMMSR